MRPIVVGLAFLAERGPQVVRSAVKPQVDPFFQRPVEALNLALRLRVIRRSEDVRYTAGLQILGQNLA